MSEKRNFIATAYFFKDNNDFDRGMAESMTIFLEDQGNGFSDADVAKKLGVKLDENDLRYYYADSKEGVSSIADYLSIYPDALKGHQTADKKPRNVIDIYTKGLLKQKYQWESLEKNIESKFKLYRKRQGQFEELIKVATDMRTKCEQDVKKDSEKLKKEISDRINKLNIPEEFKPDFSQMKSYEEMFKYLSEVSESKELASMLEEKMEIITPQKMISNAHVLYGIVFRPESVARNGSLKAPCRAFEWAASADITKLLAVCEEPTESSQTSVMSKEESYFSSKQLDSYQHDFSGKIDGAGAFISPAGLGAFSYAVSANLAKGRNKEDYQGGSTIKKEQKKASMLLRKMQEVKISRSDINIKDEELQKLKEAHEKKGAERESALLQWLVSNGTHFILRLMFGISRYFEASGSFEGTEERKTAGDVLSQALQGALSAAQYSVRPGFMGTTAAAVTTDSSSTHSSGSISHYKIQNHDITVSEKIYSNGLPTGLPAFRLNYLVNSGNYYWTVIKRYYGKNELDGIWNIIRSQHSQKMKEWKIDVDLLAKDLENIWIEKILQLGNLKLEEEDVQELLSGEDVGTELHRYLEKIQEELEAENKRKEKEEEEKRIHANKIFHGSTIYLQIFQGDYLGNPKKHNNWFSDKGYGRMRKSKGAHMVFKYDAKEGDAIESGDWIYLVAKDPVVPNYNCLYREHNDYIYYDLAASVNDEKWWSIEGDISNGGKVTLQHVGKYLTVYESWVKAIEKLPDHSSTWVITKEG